MKKYFLGIISFIFTTLFLFFLNRLYFNTSLDCSYLNHNIVTLLLLIVICYLVFSGWNHALTLPKRIWIYVILGFCFSIFFIFGTNLMFKGAVTFSSLSMWISVFIFTYIFSGLIFYYTFFAAQKLKFYLFEKEYPLLNSIFAKTNYFHFWIFIFLCWMPFLLACYPGIFSYDAKFQCSQIGETLSLTSHHPIIHTLLLGGCIQFGKNVFLSANIGLLFYSIIQMLINSSIFAYILTYIKKLKVSSLFLSIILLFFAIMPFNGLLAICATKDSIFGSFFLLLVTFLHQLIENPKLFFQKKRYPCYFIIVSFLLLILRNNMLYAYILCISILLIIYRKYWKYYLLMFFLPILLLRLYEGILFPTLNVVPGDSRERYSVIMQQFANVYNNCELASDDENLLLNLMSDRDWRQYEPHKSDAIKDHFQTSVFEQNITDYIHLWVRLGLKHPSQYLNAFLNLTYGYWYPNEIMPDNSTYRKYIEIYDGGDITFNSKIPWLYNKLWSFGMNSSYQEIPGLSIMFSPATYLWITLYLLTTSIYYKKYKFLLLTLMPFCLFFTLLLGPVAILRYLYPIILCVPLFCCSYHTHNS